MRRSDALGFAGLAMLLVGALLYLTASGERLSWVYWLGGPMLWFGGFTLVVGWVLTRWWRLKEENGAAPPSARRK